MTVTSLHSVRSGLLVRMSQELMATACWHGSEIYIWRVRITDSCDILLYWYGKRYLTWWMWVWANTESWWWTGKPGMLQSMGSQRDKSEQLNWTDLISQLIEWPRIRHLILLQTQISSVASSKISFIYSHYRIELNELLWNKGVFQNTELWDLDSVDREEKQAICPNPVIQYRNCQSLEGMAVVARARLELEPWLPNTKLSAFSKPSCYKPSAGWQWGWSISVSHTAQACLHTCTSH